MQRPSFRTNFEEDFSRAVFKPCFAPEPWQTLPSTETCRVLRVVVLIMLFVAEKFCLWSFVVLWLCDWLIAKTRRPVRCVRFLIRCVLGFVG
jgi:hypothetical protein